MRVEMCVLESGLPKYVWPIAASGCIPSSSVAAVEAILGRGNGASGREGVWLDDSELHGKDLPRACLSLLPRHIGQGGRED